MSELDKTDSELFSEAVELKKEANKARDSLDEVRREIAELKNKKDKIRVQSRNDISAIDDQILVKEEEERQWRRVIRGKDCLAEEKERAAWATRRMGV